MRNAVIAATAVTIGCGGATVLGYIADPGLSPMRIAGLGLLAIGLVYAWGRVIWMRQH